MVTTEGDDDHVTVLRLADTLMVTPQSVAVVSEAGSPSAQYTPPLLHLLGLLSTLPSQNAREPSGNAADGQLGAGLALNSGGVLGPEVAVGLGGCDGLGGRVGLGGVVNGGDTGHVAITA